MTMKQTKHTPEPWGEYSFPQSGNLNMPEVDKTVHLPRTDYRRAVACVNALAGINPDKLKTAISDFEFILRIVEAMPILAATAQVQHARAALAALKGE